MPTRTAAERLPVVIASGQSIERDDLVTPLDLMARAADSALAPVPRLRARLDRVSVVRPLGHVGPAPASRLAESLALGQPSCEVSSVGGNTPQWLVNRAASAIAAGELGATLIVGAEALRSSRDRRAAGLPRAPDPEIRPDPVVGDERPGVGPAESAIGLLLPVHVYPMLESAIAARLGHDTPTHRRDLGALLAPFTEVAAAHPFAWFPERHTAEAIATPSRDNRVVAEPYTKRMAAFLGSDQGAALVVCSLAAARDAGVEDRAVFVWSGAEANDVFSPASRPDPGRSPALAAAGRALLAAACDAAGPGGAVGIDDVALLDLYSCFPSAVEAAMDAFGLRADDGRGLTVTGGLPYFGGPGNNYTTHSVATLTDLLREGTGSQPGDQGTRFGLATGLGWFVTKHAIGLYGTEPPPGGFRRGDTSVEQAKIDDSAADVALEVARPERARVLAATVVRDGKGEDGVGPAVGAPAFVRLRDGRHMAIGPADEQVTQEMAGLDVAELVGRDLLVEPGAPRYRLP